VISTFYSPLFRLVLKANHFSNCFGLPVLLSNYTSSFKQHIDVLFLNSPNLYSSKRVWLAPSAGWYKEILDIRTGLNNRTYLEIHDSGYLEPLDQAESLSNA